MEDSGVMDLTRNVMIVSIIALFIMMMFLLFLHLYSKYYRTRFHARQQQQQQQQQQRGLDASILKTIPVIQFHPKDLDQLLECAVCLSELEEGDKARILPKCDHGFHVECIDMWLRSHSTCPICRNPLSDQTQTQQESTDGGDSNEVGTEEAIDHHRIQMRGLPCEEASSSYKNIRARGDLVIDIPGQVDEDTSVSCSPTRSLKRMLSATARFNPFSPHTATASSNV